MTTPTPTPSPRETPPNTLGSTPKAFSIRGDISARLTSIILGALAVNTTNPLNAEVVIFGDNFSNENTKMVGNPSLLSGGDSDIHIVPTLDGVKLETTTLGTGTATVRIILNFDGADIPEEVNKEGEVVTTTVTILGNYTLSRTGESSGETPHMEGTLKFGKVEVVDNVEVYSPETLSLLESGELAHGTDWSRTKSISQDIVLHGPGTYYLDVTFARTNSSGSMEIGPLAFNGDTAPIIPSATEDTDGDGFSNFYEYAFGTPPDTPNTSPITYNIGTIGGQEKFTIGFPTNYDDQRLVYTVEGSSNLSTWETIADNIHPSNSETGIVEISDTAPIAAAPRKFFRVKASIPE